MKSLFEKIETESDAETLFWMRDAAIKRREWSEELQGAYARRKVELQRGAK